MRFLILNVLAVSFLLAFGVSEAVASPAALTYQGRILKANGSPLEYSNVSFIFQIVDPSGQCVIYQEQVTGVNLTNSGGVFDVPIGSGTVQYPLGPKTVLDVFNNATTFTCGSCTLVSGTYTCVDGSSTYVASSGDLRKLRVSFYDGSGWKTISPDNVIRSVPYSAYSLSAQKLGTNVASDFLLKTGVPTCSANEFLSWNGTALVCAPVSGASGGTVTSVSSTTSYITVANGNSTPTLTLNVGTTAGTVAAGDDSRLSDARVPTGGAGGDLSGTYPNPSVAKLHGVVVSSAAPTNGQFMKFDGTQWVGAAIGISDVTNLNSTLSNYHTVAAFNSAVGGANCAAHQTPYWNSVSSSFQCQAINVSAAGDVSGTLGALSVDKIKGVAVSGTTPATGQFLIYNGTQYAPSSMSGDATMSATGAVTLKNTGTAGTYTKVTTDAQGRVTSGTTLSATDIPALDWSKITTGKPTTLSGYGITDAVQNAGATPSVQTGTVASRPAAGTAGRLYIGSDDNTLYRDTGSAWVKIGDGAGANGVTTVTASAPLASSGGTTPNITITQANSTTNGYLSSTDWNTFNNKLGTASTFSGDVSGTASTTSVDKIKGKSVVPTTYAVGQTLRYDGTNWVNAVLGFGDISGTISASQLPTVPVANGGTGMTSGTSGGIPYFSSATTMASSAALTANGVVLGGGAGASPTTTTAGTANQVLRVPGAGGAPAFGAMDISQSAAVTGTLAVANGGTGTNSLTANRILASNGTGSAITSFTCGVGQLITFDAAGVMGCTNYSSAGFFANGGNSFSGAATLGTNDNYDLAFETNSATRMTVTAAGKVGIGTASPASTLEVNGDAKITGASGLSVSWGVTAGSFKSDQLSYGAAYTSNSASYDNAPQGDSNGIFMKLSNTSTTVGTGSFIYLNAKNSAQKSYLGAVAVTSGSAPAMVFGRKTGATSYQETMRLDENGNLGLGTASPFWQQTISGPLANLAIIRYHATAYPAVKLMASGGSEGAEVAVTSGRGLGAIQFGGYDGTSANNAGAQMGSVAAENYTSTAHGTSLYFLTTPVGSTTMTERMRIDSTGNVGIGTNAPLQTLHIANSGGEEGYPGIFIQDPTTTSAYGGSLYYDDRGGLNVFKMSVTANSVETGYIAMNRDNGKVGIGTTAPTMKLHVGGASPGSADQTIMQVGDGVTTGAGALYFTYNAPYVSGNVYYDSGWKYGGGAAKPASIGLSNGIIFVTSDDTVGAAGGAVPNMINRMAITSSGNVGIATVSPSALFHVNGAALATAWNTSSDARLKTNVQEIHNPLDKILALRGVEFDWRKDIEQPTRHEQTHDIGVIAQEVERQFPEAVTTAKDGFKSVAYSKLVSPIIGAIKELYARLTGVEGQQNQQSRKIASVEEQVKVLQEQNAAKEKEIAELKARLERLEKSLGAKK